MRILITGKNSFLGNSFFEWTKEHEPSFEIERISLRNIKLTDISFKNYDVIFHVAGIAHITSNMKLITKYFKINRDLAIDVAKKSKEDGVKQFIFISSMAIYGDDLPIGVINSININQTNATNPYGQSKLEADLEIQKLNNVKFKTVILRIPMVYGKKAKGNFPKLLSFSKFFFIFPNFNNQRSVLHVNNLSRLSAHLIKTNSSGVFYPQDKEYLHTIKLIKIIRRKKISIYIGMFNFLFKILCIKFTILNKVFGNKFYLQDISKVEGVNYQIDNIYNFVK